MMSREMREYYRSLTNGQRLQITLQMIRESVPYLYQGTPEQVRRRFELLNRQNDERNRRILEALTRAREKE
jgi:hypothetical protein